MHSTIKSETRRPPSFPAGARITHRFGGIGYLAPLSFREAMTADIQKAGMSTMSERAAGSVDIPTPRPPQELAGIVQTFASYSWRSGRRAQRTRVALRPDLRFAAAGRDQSRSSDNRVLLRELHIELGGRCAARARTLACNGYRWGSQGMAGRRSADCLIHRRFLHSTQSRVKSPAKRTR